MMIFPGEESKGVDGFSSHRQVGGGEDENLQLRKLKRTSTFAFYDERQKANLRPISNNKLQLAMKLTERTFTKRSSLIVNEESF